MVYLDCSNNDCVYNVNGIVFFYGNTTDQNFQDELQSFIDDRLDVGTAYIPSSDDDGTNAKLVPSNVAAGSHIEEHQTGSGMNIMKVGVPSILIAFTIASAFFIVRKRIQKKRELELRIRKMKMLASDEDDSCVPLSPSPTGEKKRGRLNSSMMKTTYFNDSKYYNVENVEANSSSPINSSLSPNKDRYYISSDEDDSCAALTPSPTILKKRGKSKACTMKKTLFNESKQYYDFENVDAASLFPISSFSPAKDMDNNTMMISRDESFFRHSSMVSESP